MAIVQISKIQARTGANVDLPQLDVGELGYATDEGKLYIGNDPAEPLPTINGKYLSEILTTTSTLDFSRFNGSDNASMNMSNVSTGELLGITVSGNIATVTNLGGNAGGTINLGNVSNVKITGANVVGGYVLASDGNGGLTWTTNGVLRSVIQTIANVSGLAVFTTQANHLFNTGSVASVSDTQPSLVQGLLQALGVGGTNQFYVYRRTSNTFHLSTSTTFASNISYDPLFATYTANSGILVGQITPTGNATVGGTNTQVQFNDVGGVFGGVSNFTFNKSTNVLTVVGNITASNANLGNLVTSNYFSGAFRGPVGNTTTANSGTFTTVIASTANVSGTITGSIVESTNNGNGTNFKVGDDIWIGDINIPDTLQLSGVANTANAYIVFGDTDTTALGRAGSGPLTYGGDLDVVGNITANTVTSNTFTQLAVYTDDTARDAAITMPAAGMLVFNQTGAKFQGYNGTAWVNLN